MNDWVSAIAVPPLNIKNYAPDGWKAWFTQFRVHTRVTAFPKLSDQEKVDVLLLKLGGDVTPIFHTFNVGIDEVSYPELVELFAAYFSPAKTRNVFLSAKQKSGESFDQFAERLTVLSYPCCFGPFHDGLLRDVFLHNIHSMYGNIREHIFKHHRDPTFQEVLRISKELLLETRNVSRSSRDESTISVHSASRDVDTVADNALNSMKRKELDATSDSNSDESFKHNFKAPSSQPPSSSLQPKHNSAKSSFTLNNTRPVIESDSTSAPHKLSIAIKNALDNNSSKSSSSFSSNEVPKLDFAFKCFSVSEAANNNPCGGTPKPEFFPRTPSYSSSKLENTHIVNRSTIQQPLNLSCDKPAGINARLFKYGNQSRLGDAARSPVSPEKCYDTLNSNVPFKSQNVLSDNNRSSQKDCEVNSCGDSCTNEVGATCLVSPIHSNRENTRPCPQTNYDDKVNPAGTNLLFSTHRTRSSGVFPSQSTDDGLSFSSSNTGDDVFRDSIGANETNSETNKLDPKPEPPVSKNFFSEVVIVFISENDDIIFVCPVVKFQYLATIESELRKLDDENALQPIKNFTPFGKKYAAPFRGDWYRAEIISANIKKKTVRISFCDYGNEEDIPLSDLRLLPEEFQELEPLSFPIRLPKGAPEIRNGSKLKIRPLSLEDDWSWAVELRTNQR